LDRIVKEDAEALSVNDTSPQNEELTFQDD